jgi:hypothetical protein
MGNLHLVGTVTAEKPMLSDHLRSNHPRFICGGMARGYRIKYSKLSNIDHDSEIGNVRVARLLALR